MVANTSPTIPTGHEEPPFHGSHPQDLSRLSLPKGSLSGLPASPVVAAASRALPAPSQPRQSQMPKSPRSQSPPNASVPASSSPRASMQPSAARTASPMSSPRDNSLGLPAAAGGGPGLSPALSPIPGPAGVRVPPVQQYIGNYLLGKTLGHGSFAKVKAATHLPTNSKVAIKMIFKNKLKDEYARRHLRREAEILRRLDHPHIIKLYEVIETDELFCMVTEEAAGGEVLDYIVTHDRLQEKEARKFMLQVLSAVRYLHANKIVHRDLKAENLLLDGSLNIKLIDFGLSNNYTDSSFLATRCGSLSYSSPEILAGKKYVGPEVDVWSLGVNLYAMLTGKLPFEGTTVTNVHAQILDEKYALPDYLSEHCKDLFRRIFCVSSDKRITIAGLMEHPWLMQSAEPPQAAVSPSPLSPIDDKSSAGGSPAAVEFPSPRGIMHGVAETTECEAWALDQMWTMGFTRDAVVASVRKRECDALCGTFALLVLKRAKELALEKKRAAPVSKRRRGLSVAVRNTSSLRESESDKGSPGKSMLFAARRAVARKTSMERQCAVNQGDLCEQSQSSSQGHDAQSAVAGSGVRTDDALSSPTPSTSQAGGGLQRKGSLNARSRRPSNLTLPAIGPSDAASIESLVATNSSPSSPRTNPVTPREGSAGSGSRPTTPRRSSQALATAARLSSLPTVPNAQQGMSNSKSEPMGSAQGRHIRLGSMGRMVWSQDDERVDAARKRADTEDMGASGAQARFPLNCSMVSAKAPHEIRREVERVLTGSGVDYAAGSGEAEMSFACRKGELRFEIDICKIPRLALNGVRFKRIHGDVFGYKAISTELIARMRL